jgi:DNA primase
MDESDEFKMTMESIYRKSAETILTYENDYDFIEAYKAECENFVDISENRNALRYIRKKRKLSNATIEHFGLKYARTGTYEGRVIIPYYRNGIIIGFNSRYIGECSDGFRYRYMINRHRFDDYLFNEESIVGRNYCILVEGPFDLMYMHQCGFTNVISTLNTRMSNGHLKKLIGFKKIIFCFDNDEETQAGQNAVIKHAKTILKYRPQLPVYTVKLPVGKDPNECDIEELENALCHLHRIRIKTDSGS